MTAQILQFPSVASPPEGFKSTIHNEKTWFEAKKGRKGISAINRARRAAWWRARDVVTFWRNLAALIPSADLAARRHGISLANAYAAGEDARMEAVHEWRLAIAAQMMTPAYDLASIKWKRDQLDKIKRGNPLANYISKEQAVALISADEEWRRSNPLRKQKAVGR